MTDHKKEIIKMLKEIKNPKSIMMIFGFVRAAYRDEKPKKEEV